MDTFRYYAAAPERLLGQTIPVAGGVDMTFREPLGVVGLIVPWNFPLLIASWKVAPALAAGNTVVLKPAGLTPLTALELERIALEAGVPDGVLNVVAGPGSVCGRRLVEHPDVAKIAFTGSTEVGRGIAEGAAATIKRVTLELGGKSANLVFADADLERAAAAAPLAVFGNAGQDCCARSRILVERLGVDRFLEALEEVMRRCEWAIRSTRRPDGAADLARTSARRSASFVPDDAPVAIRGPAPDGAGYWFPPTVLAPVSNSDRAAREEIFGPVACVIPFSDEPTRWSSRTTPSMACRARSGPRTAAGPASCAGRSMPACCRSTRTRSVRVATPFGGFKQSGVGRELGPDALEHYTDVKNVFYATEEG